MNGPQGPPASKLARSSHAAVKLIPESPNLYYNRLTTPGSLRVVRGSFTITYVTSKKRLRYTISTREQQASIATAANGSREEAERSNPVRIQKHQHKLYSHQHTLKHIKTRHPKLSAPRGGGLFFCVSGGQQNLSPKIPEFSNETTVNLPFKCTSSFVTGTL